MAGLFVSFESAESKQDQCTNQELGLHCKGHVQNKDTLDWIDSTDMKYLKEEVWDAAMQRMHGWDYLRDEIIQM